MFILINNESLAKINLYKYYNPHNDDPVLNRNILIPGNAAT